MEINEKNIKLWSKLGPRATLGLCALDIAKTNKNLLIITCDVSTSAGLDRYRKTFTDQYIDLGIAEQNMIGVATGLASENFDVITTTFAPFQTMRCCEQIKVNLGYMQEKITMVGLASGLILGNLGFTHCCIEDLGVMRSIPNIKIISPADSLETIKAVEASIKNDSSCYIRLTGGANCEALYNKDYNFEIGKSITLKDGEDITIFGSGVILSECLKAANILDQKGFSTKVINMHTVKPIDKDAIKNSCKKSKLLISVEEHNVIGGISSAISETISQIKNSPVLLQFGINDTYSKSGSYDYLKKYYGLTHEKIIENALKVLNNNHE